MDFSRLKDFKSIALMWSGGRDSTLLLAMLRDQNIPFSIVQLGREYWTKEQKKFADSVIKEWDLQVFTFPSANVSFLGNGDEITAVFEYAVGGKTIPVLRDVIAGKRCVADLNGLRMFNSPIDFDCYLVGSKKTDTHYAMDKVIPSQEWKVGCATFVAPLYDWTGAEVLSASLAMDVPLPELKEDATDTGDIHLCTNCLNAIEGEVWCPADEIYIPAQGQHLQLNLSNFRKRFDVQ